MRVPQGEAARTLDRGGRGLSPEADRTLRVTIGHPEGVPLAFGNVYADAAELIRGRRVA